MPVSPRPTSDLVWFKSSYSGGNTTECVEAAFVPSGVLVRDSKRPEQAHLTLSAEAWTGFVAGARISQLAYGHGFSTP
ncbi:DUF397 domain-containing protein [Streptomyces sp. NPDC052043]|uniref:DUF397 domain-containing protein n=1 Tax=Streptomyces sp. NPDC052043 TaxID=3365684 RepID=UPI0037D02F7F